MKDDNQDIKLLVRLKNATEKKVQENKTENATEKSNIKKENPTRGKSQTPTNKAGDKKDPKKPQKNESVVTTNNTESNINKFFLLKFN